MRTALLAATAVAVIAVVTVPAANAKSSARSSDWVAYLAPAAACPGSDEVTGSPQLRKRAMICMINWTRRHAGLRSLHRSLMLVDAAGSKADIIAKCGDFSHHPCGTRWPAAAVQQTRYDIWGENLYYGSRSVSSPRSALLAWLESPEHRAILFGRTWRDLGVTVHAARALDGNAGVSVWVLEVAGRA